MSRTIRTNAPSAGTSSVCRDFDWAERDAERMGDPSSATGCRVLRRRHEAADHPAGERTVTADRAGIPG